MNRKDRNSIEQFIDELSAKERSKDEDQYMREKLTNMRASCEKVFRSHMGIGLKNKAEFLAMIKGVFQVMLANKPNVLTMMYPLIEVWASGFYDEHSQENT